MSTAAGRLRRGPAWGVMFAFACLLTATGPARPEPNGGLPRPSPAMVETSGGVRYELDRIVEQGETLLVFNSGEPGRPSTGAPLAVQAQVLDRLLTRQIAARPLPAHVQVRIGEPRQALVANLQARLQAPEANWDVRRGRALRGASGPVIQAGLVAALASSPLPAVFARHGYRLHLDKVARVELGHSPSAPHATLPVEVGEMYFFAESGR